MDQKHRPNDWALETRMKGMMSYDLMETIRNTNEWMGLQPRHGLLSDLGHDPRIRCSKSCRLGPRD